MFIDTSVFVAIICGEEEEPMFTKRIAAARAPFTSPVVRLETVMVLSTRLRMSPLEAEAVFDEMIGESRIEVRPLTDEIGRLAVAAFHRFGKGRRNPARLNLSDCLSYACAKAHDVSILYKGRDFARTDVRSALD